MKKNLNLLLLFTALFLLQSCVSNYKPSSFDVEAKIYNDYKKNYSIVILDGYNLISSDMKEKLKKSFFPTAPKDTTIFYNKTNEAALAIFVTGDVKIQSDYEKQKIIRAMEEALYKVGDKCKECKNLRVIKNGNELIVELDVTNEFADAKTIINMVPFPLSHNNSRHGIFAFIGASKVKVFDKFKEDYLIMQKSIHAPAFTESERKTN